MPYKTSSKPISRSRAFSQTFWTTGGRVSPDHPQYQPPMSWSSNTLRAPVESFAEQSEKSWGVTPGYHDLKRSGSRVPPQPFELYRSEAADAQLLYLQEGPLKGTSDDFVGDTFYNQSEIGTMSSWGIGGGISNSARNGSAVLVSDDELILDARLKLKDARRTWQSAVFAAEAGKTFKMVAQTAEKIVNTLRFVRKGNNEALRRIWGPPKKGAPRGTGSSNLWLEYSYGWLPAISDARTATLALDQAIYDFGRKPVLQTFKRNIKRGRTRSETVQVSSQFDPFGRVDVEISHLIRSNKRLCFEWRIDQPNLERFGRLGLLNPLEVAWELVPLSFVADWFIPIGNYFSSLDAGVGIEFPHGYSISSKEVIESTCTSVYAYRSGVSASLQGKPAPRVSTHVDRRVFGGSLPLASPPRLDPNLGVRRLTSALSLMRVLSNAR